MLAGWCLRVATAGLCLGLPAIESCLAASLYLLPNRLREAVQIGVSCDVVIVGAGRSFSTTTSMIPFKICNPKEWH